MLLTIPDLLTHEEVSHCRTVLEQTDWIDGRATAGTQAAQIKFNLQVPQDNPAARQLGEIVLRALGRHPAFTSAALPLRILPPMFNRYDVGMKFDAHVDNAIRTVPGGLIRTDVSSTLFLTPPEDYDGGDLVIHDTYGVQKVKLPAGHIVVYPSTSLHSVTPVTRGSRWSSILWSQSMIRDNERRAMLYELDGAIQQLRAMHPDNHPAVLTLTNHYHNLLRQWAEM